VVGPALGVRCQVDGDGPGGAAEVLGVPPTTLRSRLKQMGLEKPAQLVARAS
jgi:hypothetical protein